MSMPTLFKSLAELLEKVEATKKRLKIIGLTADFLKGLDAEELEPAVSMILGRQGLTGTYSAKPSQARVI
jgi:hypothetical protein